MKKENVSTVTILTKRDRCKGHYKLLWVLSAIIILAVWSMLTGSLSLKWCAENLTRFSHDFVSSTTFDDLDILEMDEREKVVRHMWDVYTHSRSTKLPHFWSEAFHAAYEHLVSDVPGVRDAAFSEIAKMSLQPLYFPHDTFLLKSHSMLVDE
ncbi:hypothetical protein TanjilG_14707 [Lupinus angustifolius]|uniref:Uncharacterized protein n=1 Tax=Lupinus angustifolius TaxID=3871 RepID=A0A1J7HAK5_LUPAN|nr:hypothetical protein TanjilG_14707 [Lupinus angustifolius]